MVEYITRKNNISDKPNEDYIFVEEERNIYILLDGVTRDREAGKYPCPSPAVEVNKIFVDRFIDVVRKDGLYINTEAELKGVIEKANDAIGEYNLKFSHRFPAGAVGVIVVLTQEGFISAYIGDCYGAVLSEQSIKYFTEPQTKNIAIHKKEFTSDQIRFEICNNPNHVYAYGVLDGNKQANHFVITGKHKLNPEEKILLYSDGAINVEKLEVKDMYNESVLKIADIIKNTTNDDYSILRISL